MKLLNAVTTSLIYSLLPSLSIASSPWRYFESQTPIKAENIPVEGDNPLVYCADPSAHLLQIDAVDLYPNPPKPYVQTFILKIFSAVPILSVISWPNKLVGLVVKPLRLKQPVSYLMMSMRVLQCSWKLDGD